MKRNSLVCRTGVLAAGTVVAVLPSLGVATMTLGTMAAVDLPEGAGRDIAVRQYQVIPIETVSDFCAGHNRGDGYYAHPHDKAVFYRCIDSGNQRVATYQFRCPDKAWYDADRLVCVARVPR
ncbi:chitin binding peritrophin-A domain-containing protein [Nocardia iowensis]|uniref:Chitin binding domain-containing protein n=1 Tax=Nocardia iowensis TaxID=204891 RepID=A0ABX8RXJ3_NOCIO|nr:chitin binding peritrophin-A domain-containing protein [Nocardia iowensis]QXN93120.1 chitin binding domain-containing protein [Nocardia iowensis]